MCYAKPGPRCSTVAKKRLDNAVELHRKHPTEKNAEKLKKAKNDYSLTTEGIKNMDSWERRDANELRQRAISAAKRRGIVDSNPGPGKMFDTPIRLTEPREGSIADQNMKEVYQIGERSYLSIASYTKSAGYAQYWLEEGGDMVGFMNTRDPLKDTDELVINSVEVREGYQGQGKLRTLLQYVEKLSGKRLVSTGECTPKGYAALKGKVGLTEYGEWKANFEDMFFVHDDNHWDHGVFR